MQNSTLLLVVYSDASLSYLYYAQNACTHVFWILLFIELNNSAKDKLGLSMWKIKQSKLSDFCLGSEHISIK